MSIESFPVFRLYVRPDGDDRASGESDAPLASLMGARDRLRQLRREGCLPAPCEVIFEDGHYAMTEPVEFSPEDSGRIVFRAKTPGKAVFDGSEVVTGWELCEVNGVSAWRVRLTGFHAERRFCRTLWANGRMCRRARFPKFDPTTKEGREKVFRVAEQRPMADHNPLKHNDYLFKPDPADPIRDWASLYDAEVVVLHYWTDERLTQPRLRSDGWIESSRCSTFCYREDWKTDRARYYIDNLFEALTDPGEWYFHSEEETLYYIPAEGESPENTEIRIPVLRSFIRLQGVPYNRDKRMGDIHGTRLVEGLSFEGLVFQRSDWRHVNPRMLFHDAIPEPERPLAANVQAAMHVPGAVDCFCASNCALIDCTVREVGSYAVDIREGCRGIRVASCTFDRLGAGGVKVHGAELDEAGWARTGHCTVTDCLISNAGLIFHSGIGVMLGSTFENIVANNRIEDLFYSGISVGWSWGYKETITRDNEILFNRIRNIGQGLLSDMGAIYCLGVQPGTRIKGNHINDVRICSYGGWGVYLDEGSSGIVVEENLVYGTERPPFFLHFGRENIVRNNILMARECGCVGVGRSEGHVGVNLYQNILITGNGLLYSRRPGNEISAIVHGLSNLVWSPEGNPIHCPGDSEDGEESLSLEELQGKGVECSSLCADPGLTRFSWERLDELDWTLPPGSPAARLGFQNVDWNACGPRPVDRRDPLESPLTRLGGGL